MPALDIMLAFGAFVQHTQRITVGTCVVIAPLRNPAILAKETATLDFLSGGRVVLGVGVGGSSNSRSDAFDVCGVDPRQRGAITDEMLEIMTKLWTARAGEPPGPVPLLRKHRDGPGARPEAPLSPMGRRRGGGSVASGGKVVPGFRPQQPGG